MSAAAVAFPSPRLLFCGLDESLTLELKYSLPGCDSTSHPVMPEDLEACTRLLQDSRAHIVFAPAEKGGLKLLLDTARAQQLPVVVIARTEDNRQWLDAMDAGAADYAAPPFEREQMRWMLRVITKGWWR